MGGKPLSTAVGDYVLSSASISLLSNDLQNAGGKDQFIYFDLIFS
jgi:hypothetical protein